MPRGRVDLEQVGKVARTSRRDSTKAKRRNSVFYSSVDWKLVESTKMRGDVVCRWTFHDEAGGIVRNFLKSVYEVLRAARKEGK